MLTVARPPQQRMAVGGRVYGMSKTSLSFFFLFAFGLFAFAALMCASATGQNNFKVLHSFSGYPNDGLSPVSDVVFDRAGNLYGTTAGGGSGNGCGDNGCGTVYELSPNKDGSWSEAVIYSFCTNFDGQDCLDGSYPDGGLVLDPKGNLYGATSFGGPDCPTECSMGCGVLFELSPPLQRGESWSETVLHNFCSTVANGQCLDGASPTDQLIFDAEGNLYGTTFDGGSGHAPGGGTAFEFSPSSKGWIETILYNFCSQGTGNDCPDGYSVYSGLTFDTSGNLYGTATYSGSENDPSGGTVYELSRSGDGWKHQTLLAIPPNSKSNILQGGLAFDVRGNLYGTFSFTEGGVFRLDLLARKIQIFSFNGSDGFDPIGGVYVNSQAEAVYGTTSGSDNGPGNIFQITKNGTETVLHKFCSFTDCTDGEIPWATLVPDKAGNLYGTTEFGGNYGAGVVFEITP